MELESQRQRHASRTGQPPWPLRAHTASAISLRRASKNLERWAADVSRIMHGALALGSEVHVRHQTVWCMSRLAGILKSGTAKLRAAIGHSGPDGRLILCVQSRWQEPSRRRKTDLLCFACQSSVSRQRVRRCAQDSLFSTIFFLCNCEQVRAGQAGEAIESASHRTTLHQQCSLAYETSETTDDEALIAAGMRSRSHL